MTAVVCIQRYLHCIVRMDGELNIAICCGHVCAVSSAGPSDWHPGSPAGSLGAKQQFIYRWL